MTADPDALVYNLGDYWRAKDSGQAILVVGRLLDRRSAVAGSAEGTRRGRDEVADLTFMRDTILAHMDPDDTAETLEDVVLAVRAAEPWWADFLNTLIDHYAHRYSFDTLRRR